MWRRRVGTEEGVEPVPNEIFVSEVEKHIERDGKHKGQQAGCQVSDRYKIYAPHE